MFGVIPFGLVFGVIGIESGLTSLQTILLSSILFGGASQVVFAQLWAGGVPALILGSSVCVINIRHVLYSASVASYLKHLSLGWRLLLGYLLTDEAYAVSIRRFTNGYPGKFQHFHLLGSGSLLWASWQTSTIAGVFVGETIPETWSLSFAIPLNFYCGHRAHHAHPRTNCRRGQRWKPCHCWTIITMEFMACYRHPRGYCNGLAGTSSRTMQKGVTNDLVYDGCTTGIFTFGTRFIMLQRLL